MWECVAWEECAGGESGRVRAAGGRRGAAGAPTLAPPTASCCSHLASPAPTTRRPAPLPPHLTGQTLLYLHLDNVYRGGGCGCGCGGCGITPTAAVSYFPRPEPLRQIRYFQWSFFFYVSIAFVCVCVCLLPMVPFFFFFFVVCFVCLRCTSYNCLDMII